MTKLEIKTLDILYQVEMLERYKHSSIFGGKATLVHHFVQGRTNAIRWYTKNAIPLTLKQHNKIHNKDGGEMNKIIIRIKGRQWNKQLVKQSYKILKNSDLDYEKIKSHILGERKNYV